MLAFRGGRARATSADSDLQDRIYPKPPIVLWVFNQLGPNRISLDVFAFLSQALIRPQHVVEGLFFPDRTGEMKQPVDAMRGSTLETLKYVDERKRPAFLTAERRKEQVHMIGHHHERVQLNSRCACGAGALACERPNAGFSQCMFKDKIAGLIGQDRTCAGAESNK